MFLTISLLVLAFVYFTSVTMRVLLSAVALLKVIAYLQGSGLELRYSGKNELFREFVAKSEITRMWFEPYFLSLTPLAQGVIYMVAETVHQKYFPQKFAREILKLPDGGTIGIDWDEGIPDANEKPEKPILILCPGLNGESDNLYSTALVDRARH